MDILLIYIIKELLLPCSSLLLISFIGWYRFKKHKNMGSSLLLGALLGLYALSTPLFSNVLAGLLEGATHQPLSASVQKDYQAIVVLGGGTRSNSYEYGDDITVSLRTLERLRYAATLGKKTGLPILVSGGQVFSDSKVSESVLMAGILANEFNVAVRWQESRSRNTAENAQYSRALLRPLHIDKILLVTQAFHIPRAITEFKRVGFDVLAAPTGFLHAEHHLRIFSFIPSAEALTDSSYIFHEYLGLLWYRLRYA
jgi:uncharacterized SAM-binding protein YcdF (DUF218 family)